MKHKTVTLTIKVPAWWPTGVWRRAAVAWRTLKFQWTPFRCTDCGTAINFRFPTFYHTAPGKNRLMLSVSPFDGAAPREGICGHCLAVRIRAVFASATPGREGSSGSRNGLNKPQKTYTAVCDCCDTSKRCIDISWNPQCNIRFGTNWWNGHMVCEDCLCETAEHGTAQSMMHGYDNGWSYQLNSAGAAIGLPHWWSILFKRKVKRDENQTRTVAGSSK